MSLLKLKSMAGILPKNMVSQVASLTPLAPSDAGAFWGSVQGSPAEATRVLTELLGRVVEVERAMRGGGGTGKGAASAASSGAAGAVQGVGPNSRDLDRALWMLVYTMRFIDLYFGVDAQDKMLRRAMAAYEAHRAEHRAASATAIEADQLIRTLSRGALERQDTTNALVLECTMINSVESALLASEGQRDLSFSVLRDNSFVHLRLMAQIMHGGENTRQVFEELVMQLEAQQKMIRARPVITNSALGNVMAMLYTLKEAIRSFPVVDLVLLKRALMAVRGYLDWPLPFGSFAKLVADLLEDEARLPGSNLRARILAENPILTGFGTEQSEKYGPQGVDWSRNHRIVAVMYSGNVPRAQAMRKNIARNVSRSHHPYLSELNTTREEVLVSIMETLLRNKANPAHWKTALLQTLRNKHAADLSEWFTKSMTALNKNKVDPKELLAVLKTVAPSLVDGVDVRLDQNGGAARDEEEDDAFASGAPKASSSNMVSTKDPAMWNHTVPRLPQLYFEFLDVSPTGEGVSFHSRRTRTEIGGSSFTGDVVPGEALFGGNVIGGGERGGGGSNAKKSLVERAAAGARRNSKNAAKGKSRMSLTIPGMDIFTTNPAFDNSDAIPGALGFHKCPQRYVLYGAEYDDLLRDVRALFPPDYAEGTALEKTQALGRAAKPVLRRVLLGGHDVLHRAVAVYTALRAMEPDLCANVDFRFYLVPVGRNDLAAFLAQRDGWYRKNVFVPFHGPLLLLPVVKYTNVDAIDLETGLEDLAHGGAPPPRHALSGAQALPKRPDSMGGGFGDESADAEYASTGGGGGGGGAGEDGDEDGGNSTTGKGRELNHRLDANPPKLLRHLLAGYVRGAEVAWPVTVFDCECWESPDAIEMERGPDLTIPFCLRVEFGLGAAIAEHTSTEDFTTNFMGEAPNEGLGPDFSLSEILTDKSFVKAVSGNPAPTKLTTPELNVCMFRMDVDGNLHAGHMRDIMELPDASYLSLVVASTPRMTFPLSSAASSVAVEGYEPPATSANPTLPSVEVQTVVVRSQIVELIKKKDKKDKDVDVIKDHLRLDCRTHHVGLVDVRASNSSRLPFNISVDGKVFGPYYRVRIRGSTALSKSGGQAMFSRAPALFLPVMSFLPTEGGLGADDGTGGRRPGSVGGGAW